MANLKQYLVGPDVPTTLPGIDFRPLQAGLLPGKALEQGGNQLNRDMLALYDKDEAVREEKRKAALTVSALDRFSQISRAVEDAESNLKKSGLPSDRYMGGWVAVYNQTVNAHLKGVKDPDEMALVLKHLYPFEAQRYAQARGYSDKLWGSELEAKTENSLQWLENEARKDGEAGKPVDWIQGYIDQSRLNVESAGAAYAPEKAAEQVKKAQKRIVDSYVRSRVETDPTGFMLDHVRGKNEKLRGMISPDDYWHSMDRAYNISERIRDQVEKGYKKNSEEVAKTLRLKIINGEGVGPQLLRDLSPVMTDSDIGNIDSLRRTYDDYNARDRKTDQDVYDTLNGRIVRDEMVDEKALIPYAKSLNKTDFTHLYNTIIQRQTEREKEDKPRGRLVKAGRNYISRIFAVTNTDLDFDRVVNQVGSEALALYDESMARDQAGKLDPMDLARDVSAKFGGVVNGRIKYGTSQLQPVLRYTNENDALTAYESGKIDRSTYNSQVRIINRMRRLAADLEAEQNANKGKK